MHLTAGRLNVIDILLATPEFTGFLGIIDADFDHLERAKVLSGVIFRTDTHDAETMMLRTNAFEAVVSEFCSPEKRRQWESTSGARLRDKLLAESSKIGLALWFSQRNTLGLDFKNLNVTKFFDEHPIEISTIDLAKHIMSHSGHPHAPADELVNGIANLSTTKPDLWQVTRGHDFMALLAQSLRDAIGSCDRLEVTMDILESHLRVAYGISAFSQTALYSSVNAWAEVHKPYDGFLTTAAA